MGCTDSKDANQPQKNTVPKNSQDIQSQKIPNAIQNPDVISTNKNTNVNINGMGPVATSTIMKNSQNINGQMKSSDQLANSIKLEESKVKNPVEESQFNISQNKKEPQLEQPLEVSGFKALEKPRKGQFNDKYGLDKPNQQQQIQSNPKNLPNLNNEEIGFPKISKEKHQQLVDHITKKLEKLGDIGSDLASNLVNNEINEGENLEKLIIDLLNIKKDLDYNMEDLKAHKFNNDDDTFETIKLFSATIRKIKQFYDSYQKKLKPYKDFRILACDLLEKCGIKIPEKEEKEDNFDFNFDDNGKEKLETNTKNIEENFTWDNNKSNNNPKNTHAEESANQPEKNGFDFNFGGPIETKPNPKEEFKSDMVSDFGAFVSDFQEEKPEKKKDKKTASKFDKDFIMKNDDFSQMNNKNMDPFGQHTQKEDNFEKGRIQDNDFQNNFGADFSKKPNEDFLFKETQQQQPSVAATNTKEFLKENKNLPIVKIEKLGKLDNSGNNLNASAMSREGKYDKLERLRLVKERNDAKFELDGIARHYNRAIGEYKMLKRKHGEVDKEYQTLKNEITKLKSDINEFEYQNSTLETENNTLVRTLENISTNESSLKERNNRIKSEITQATSKYDNRNLEAKRLEQDPTLKRLEMRIAQTQEELTRMQKLYNETSERYQAATNEATKEKLEKMKRETTQAVENAKLENIASKDQLINSKVSDKENLRASKLLTPPVKIDPGRLSFQYPIPGIKSNDLTMNDLRSSSLKSGGLRNSIQGTNLDYRYPGVRTDDIIINDSHNAAISLVDKSKKLRETLLDPVNLDIKSNFNGTLGSNYLKSTSDSIVTPVYPLKDDWALKTEAKLSEITLELNRKLNTPLSYLNDNGQTRLYNGPQSNSILSNNPILLNQPKSALLYPENSALYPENSAYYLSDIDSIRAKYKYMNINDATFRKPFIDDPKSSIIA